MNFLTITEQHRLDTLAAAFAQREQELFGYQINIDNYTAMLAALPTGAPPARLAAHVARPLDALPMDTPPADVQAVADYQYRDQLARLLRSERIEQGKAARVLAAIKSQLPAARLAALPSL